MKLRLGFGIFAVLLIGCKSAVVSSPTPPLNPTMTSRILPSTVLPTETLLPSSLTVTDPPPTETATLQPPTTTPIPACVILRYGEYAQFEIFNQSGQRILVDVYDPERLTSPVSATDILLTTHTHWDHLNEDFQTAFPGPQLFVQTGMLEASGAIIQGIASAHNQGDALKAEGGTNYIYVIEIGGLRIVHFGDIGQETLSQEQLSIIGQVDIAITQLNNPYSDMNAENAKGIHLMEQVAPRLIIPTHVNLDTTKVAVAQWPGFFTESTSLQICDSDLSLGGTQVLLMGEAAETMIKYVDLLEWGRSDQ
jgi:L-ascorbate metabolism protein UlaG (beta-lactamase superfamily)